MGCEDSLISCLDHSPIGGFQIKLLLDLSLHLTSLLNSLGSSASPTCGLLCTLHIIQPESPCIKDNMEPLNPQSWCESFKASQDHAWVLPSLLPLSQIERDRRIKSVE